MDYVIGISDVVSPLDAVAQAEFDRIADANSAAAAELMDLIDSGAESTATVTPI